MVATDSYRLAVADIALEGAQENFEAIVSGVFLQEVAGLPKMEENIIVALRRTRLCSPIRIWCSSIAALRAISRTIVRLFHSHKQRRRASLRRSSLPQEARGLGECFRRP